MSIDWSKEVEKFLMVDWAKPVQTDSGSEVVKLDGDFESRNGKATLFKVKGGKFLSSHCYDWVGYQVHGNLRCYAAHGDQELTFGIRNVPTKREGWIAILAEHQTLNPLLLRHASAIYATMEYCQKRMNELGSPVLCYQRIEWEEP